MKSPSVRSWQIPAKVVLGGEHSVLRGGKAIALPWPEKSLEITWEPGTSGGFRVEPEEGADLVGSLLQEIQKLSGRQAHIEGVLKFRNGIPGGAGLGSSAALTVGLTRFWIELHGLPSQFERDWARELENRFHGRSSGMDIAAVSLGVPIEFHREAGPRILQAHWTPKLTIHDSGIRASTAVCVQKVMALHDQDPEGARALDLRMQQAVNLIRQALEGPLSPESIESFRSGIEAGHEVFRAWGLVPEPAEKLREDLKSRGALAVRLTGAGDGGFLLAFWD